VTVAFRVAARRVTCVAAPTSTSGARPGVVNVRSAPTACPEALRAAIA
jgi:hypothetical protein